MICYEAILGLKVTFFKSELLGVRVEAHGLQDFANILECKVGSFPSSYLRFPLHVVTCKAH